jgi:lysyl-tRNA synthetase, class II
MTHESDQDQVRRDKLAALQGAGADPFAIHRYDRTHTAQEILDGFETLDGQDVTICGRLMLIRKMGKAAFAQLQDVSGRIQIYAKRDDLGEEAYDAFKRLDIGDIIGGKGFVFRTQTGETTVHLREVTLLSKSLRPLPEKFHGLQDQEQRYRQRYVDLIVNSEVREIFRKRCALVQAVRQYLDERGFLEVETPILQPIYGGAAAKPFTTHHNALDMQLYMRIAPELYLKRLVVGGLERVYEIGRMFRNEGIDTRHNPEFTMLEAYQAYTDYAGMMDLFEGLVCAMAQAVNGCLQFAYRGHEIDLTPPWRRVPLIQSVRDATGVDFSAFADDPAGARAASAGLDLGKFDGDDAWALMNKAFDRHVQPTLIQPTFVTDYPVAISPLAKRKAEEPDLTARFEPFIGGEEIGNAFSELNDPLDQKARFEQQERARAEGDVEAHPYDRDFVNALEFGLPPTGGMGMGIDRMAMLLLDKPNLREVVLFPLLRTDEA